MIHIGRLLVALLLACASVISVLSQPTKTCSIGHHNHAHKMTTFNPSAMTKRIDEQVRWQYSMKAYTKPFTSVGVQWWGVSDPSTDDQLALYPCRADPFVQVPADMVNVSNINPQYLTTGAGNFTYPLINMRDDFCFRLVRGLITSPIVVAEAPVLRNKIPNFPTGVHLALAADGRSIVVQWTTGTSRPQQVQWGSSSSKLINTLVTEKTLTYTEADMCGYPANSVGFTDPGYMHLAYIPGDRMQPGQRYYYRVGSKTDGWSSASTFLAPLEKGSVPEGGMKFIIFNDVGMIDPVYFVNVCPPYCPVGVSARHRQLSSAHSHGEDIPSSHAESVLGAAAPPGVAPGQPYLYAAHTYAENSTWLSKILPVTEMDAHVALLIGDLSYSQGFVADWDAFAQQFEPSFSMWPMMVALGNHERDWPGTGDAFNDEAHDSGGECGIPTTYRYYTPAAERSGWDPNQFYYSFDMGPVHFLILDSEVDTHPESPQGRFVAKDLDGVDRSKTPWVVVGFHRMMYAPLTSDSREYQGDLYVQWRLQEDLEDVFKGKVDLVVSGHSHAYGRTCPVYKQECVQEPNKVHYKPGAPIYILSGNAGAGFTNNFCPGPQVNVDPSSPVCNNITVASVPRYSNAANLTQPDWLVTGRMFLSGYMRLLATETELKVEAIGSHDGAMFDEIILRVPQSQETNQ